MKHIRTATLFALPLLCSLSVAQAGQPPAKGGAPGAEPPSGAPMMHHMKMMDTNQDGQISDSEINAFHDKRFDEADTNKDGALSREEFHAMHKRMMEHMKDMQGKGGMKDMRGMGGMGGMGGMTPGKSH